jgi:hypothetical protein
MSRNCRHISEAVQFKRALLPDRDFAVAAEAVASVGEHAVAARAAVDHVELTIARSNRVGTRAAD